MLHFCEEDNAAYLVVVWGGRGVSGVIIHVLGVVCSTLGPSLVVPLLKKVSLDFNSCAKEVGS